MPGTGIWSASGAIADVNTLLAALTFTPSLNYNSDFTIATSVDDGVAQRSPVQRTMTGTAHQRRAGAESIIALTITEGGSVVLSSSEISATDADNASRQFDFRRLPALTGGQFELLAQIQASPSPVSRRPRLRGGAVRFVHDGGEAAPGYNVRVSDGSLSDGPAAAAITFTNVSDAPVLVQ